MSASAVVLLTEEQLESMLERAAERGAERAMAAARPSRQALLSGAQMAKAGGWSRATMHRMRLAGCPAVKIGDDYRYEPDVVMAWLRQRSGAPDAG